MKKTGIVLIVLVILAVLGIYIGGISPAETTVHGQNVIEADHVEILLQEFMLDPFEVVIHAGTEVTWLNLDAARHNVISDTGEFDSPALAFGDKFSYIFDHPGEYTYFNKYHPDMNGKIIVVP